MAVALASGEITDYAKPIDAEKGALRCFFIQRPYHISWDVTSSDSISSDEFMAVVDVKRCRHRERGPAKWLRYLMQPLFTTVRDYKTSYSFQGLLGLQRVNERKGRNICPVMGYDGVILVFRARTFSLVGWIQLARKPLCFSRIVGGIIRPGPTFINATI